MKIYQIHEHFGDYEDYTDSIVSSYVDRHKAINSKLELEAIEEIIRAEDKKCNNCPFQSGETINEKEAKTYCDKFSLYKSPYENIFECRNYSTRIYDCWYTLEEVEVFE